MGVSLVDDVRLEPGTWSRRNIALIVGAEVVLSLALGFFRLGDKSLWFDEGFTAMASSRGLGGAIGSARHFDSNMFGYTAPLSLWREVFGGSEAELRSLSVLALASTVVAVFLVASRLFGTTTGLYAGLLIALAPFAVRYGQELRAYSFLLLFVTLASFCFVGGIETRETRWWVWYACAAAAACYAHLFGGLVILAHVVSLLALGRARIPTRQVVGALAGAAVLLSPLGYFVVSAQQSAGSGSRPTLASAASVASNVAGGKLLLVILGGLTLLAATLGWRSWRAHGRSVDTWRSAFVFAWLIVPFVAGLLSALVLQPNWQDRYLIVVLPALVIAAAVGLRQIGDRRVVIALLVVIAVFAGLKLKNWYQAPSHEDWRSAAALVTRSGSPADGIVFCIPPVRAPFEYYALRKPPATRPTPISPSPSWASGLHLDASPTNVIAATQPAPQRIWVVSRYASATETGACDLATSMKGRTRAVSKDIGNVLVERYDLG